MAVVVDEVVEGVTKGTSGGECYGTYDSSTGIGSGAGYVNACIHSGSNSGTSGNTVRYNYGAATAGTIVDASSTANANNTIVATESLCPKGWTLPSKNQIDSISGGTTSGSTAYIDSFSPTMGGRYYNESLSYESTEGYWWGSTAYNGATRYYLIYDSSSLYTNGYYGGRSKGYYIRCVSEEKDVSDLTYMQDMTPSMTTMTAWNLCLSAQSASCGY